MTGRDRTWLAYPLTVFAAGVGHWYLGEWKRGGVWLALYVVALAFLSARSISGAFDPGSPFVVTALQFDAVRFVEVAVPLSVLVVCLLDVWLRTIADPEAK